LVFLFLTFAAAGDQPRAPGQEAAQAAVVGSRPDLQFEREVTIPTTLYHFFFQKNNFGIYSTLYVQNLADVQAQIGLDFPDAPSATLTRTIPAQGVLVLPAETVTELPDGTVSRLIISSTQTVESLVLDWVPLFSGDFLASSSGTNSSSALLHFAPLSWMPGSISTGITLWNIQNTGANINISFFNQDGSTEAVLNDVIPAQGSTTYFPLPVPDGYFGHGFVSADQPLLGLMSWQDPGTNGVLEYVEPLTGGGSTQGHLARVFKAVDEGGGPRTSFISLSSAGIGAPTGVISYLEATGVVALAAPFNLSIAGSTSIDLALEPALSPGGVWAVAFASDQPMYIDEIALYDAAIDRSTTTYKYEVVPFLAAGLPRIARTPLDHSVFSLQNVDSSSAVVTLSYHDISGTLVYSHTDTIPAGGWLRYAQRQMPQLGDVFEGSVTIESDQQLLAAVDLYSTPVLADFTATPTEGPPPLEVDFTNTSLGDYTEISWEFGDGTTSTITDPLHTYLLPGAYTVTLTVGDGSAVDTEIKPAYINVLSPGITIDPATGGTLIYTDTLGNVVEIVVPPNAVSETITLMYTPIITLPAPAPLGDLFAGLAFTLEVEQGGLPQPEFMFNRPVTATVRYTDTLLEGLSETELFLYYWEETSMEWLDVSTTCSPPSSYDRDLPANTFSVPFCHLTDLGLFGIEPEMLYLPYTERNP
jgi:hypothetical protein